MTSPLKNNMTDLGTGNILDLDNIDERIETPIPHYDE